MYGNVAVVPASSLPSAWTSTPAPPVPSSPPPPIPPAPFIRALSLIPPPPPPPGHWLTPCHRPPLPRPAPLGDVVHVQDAVHRCAGEEEGLPQACRRRRRELLHPALVEEARRGDGRRGRGRRQEQPVRAQVGQEASRSFLVGRAQALAPPPGVAALGNAPTGDFEAACCAGFPGYRRRPSGHCRRKVEASTVLVPSELEFVVGPISFSGPYCKPNVLFQDVLLQTMLSDPLMHRNDRCSGETPYSAITSALQINDDEVQQWIVNAIAFKILDCRVDQLNRTVIVSWHTERIFGMPQWQVGAQNLESGSLEDFQTGGGQSSTIAMLLQLMTCPMI